MRLSLRRRRRSPLRVALLILWALPGCLLPDFERVDDAPRDPPAAGEAACCSALPESGCTNTVVSECVCAVDAYCCDSEWDATCAEQIEGYGCGACAGHPAPGAAGAEELETECASDADCGEGAPRCAGGLCVQCAEDQHCNAIDVALPYCGIDGFCGECKDDGGCAALYGDDYPSCRLGLCVECAGDGACAAGLSCIEGTCG